jgi:hypothetical protein
MHRFRVAILRRMTPPECRRFGEKVMRQLNEPGRDWMQNRTPPLPIPPHRLSRTIGATPAEKQLQLRQNTPECGFCGRQTSHKPCVAGAGLGWWRMAASLPQASWRKRGPRCASMF